MDRDPWDANQSLDAEADGASEQVEDNELLLTVPRGASPQGSNELKDVDLYRSVLTAAIEHGGRVGDHTLPVPWLRMTLAGLDFKLVEPEMMWYGFLSEGPGDESLSGAPGYGALFPGS